MVAVQEPSARGRFITVEGGEGVGKSVFTTNLAAAIRARGLTLVTTREPGGTPTANKIRALFATPAPDDPLLMNAEALLVSAARAQHVGRLIAPALARGEWVLCDRFADSMRVYQGVLGGLDETDLEQVTRFAVRGTMPDLTFLLDVDVQTAQSRLSGRGAAGARDPDAIERYDDKARDFHEKLRRAYLKLAEREPQRFVKLDAGEAPEAVARKAFAVLEERFGRL